MSTPLTTGLDALRTSLGEGVRLDVIGLEPGRVDLERWFSRARARVLVTAEDAADPEPAARALLAAQAHEVAVTLEAVPDHLWGALGRTPQAAFITVVDIEAEVPHPEVAIVRHPLEVQRVPIPSPHADAARRP